MSIMCQMSIVQCQKNNRFKDISLSNVMLTWESTSWMRASRPSRAGRSQHRSPDDAPPKKTQFWRSLARSRGEVVINSQLRILPVWIGVIWFNCLVHSFGSLVWFTCLVHSFGSLVRFTRLVHKTFFYPTIFHSSKKSMRNKWEVEKTRTNNYSLI